MKHALVKEFNQDQSWKATHPYFALENIFKYTTLYVSLASVAEPLILSFNVSVC